MTKKSKILLVENIKHLSKELTNKIEKAGFKISDIETYNKPIKNQLKEDKERYHALFDSSHVAVLILDKNRILDANQSALKLFGFLKKNELLSYHFGELAPPKQENGLNSIIIATQRITEALTQGKSFFEWVQCRRNGKEFKSEVVLTTLHIKGKPVLQATIRDITKKENLEENLFKIQKLESVGNIAGGIANDFNNILTTILGNLSIVKMDLNPGSEIFESIIEMEKAILNAKELTKQLLSFSQGSEITKTVVSMKSLIKDTVQFVLKNTKVKPQFSFSDKLWPVQIDEFQITQVLDNIINNAIQVMPKGGKIAFKAKNIELDSKNEYDLDPGNYIMLSISDQGKGISKENIEKIFDPYFTTKKGKSGLGLSVSYSIIKKHYGEIKVKSIIGKGTTFQILLPAMLIKTEETKKRKKTIYSGKGKILIMDDDTMLQKSAARILQRLGYDATFASEGNEAIKYYKEALKKEEPFDIVILDLTIPNGMGGRETIKKLKEIDNSVTAIVSSGYSNDPVVSYPLKYGFQGVIPKPYTINEMSEALHQILNKKK